MSPIKSLILAPLATVASEVWRGSKPAIGPGHSEECPPASLIKRRPARIREAAKILAAVMRLSEPGCYTRVRNPGQGEYTIFHSNESTLLKWSAQTPGGIAMQKIREEDWLQTKINGALADYVRASEFKPTEERALTAVTMVKHLWAICFWGSWIFFIGLGSLLLLILHLHATL